MFSAVLTVERQEATMLNALLFFVGGILTILSALANLIGVPWLLILGLAGTAGKLLTTAEVAEYLGVSRQYVRLLRLKGGGPRYVKLSGKYGRVRYVVEDVLEFIGGRKFSSTTEAQAAAAANVGEDRAGQLSQ